MIVFFHGALLFYYIMSFRRKKKGLKAYLKAISRKRMKNLGIS
jgi:hypothetical protein